jgi:hypothetical protein
MELVGGFITFLVTVVLSILLQATCVYVSWNYLLFPDMPAGLTFVQAIGAILVVSTLCGNSFKITTTSRK